MTPTDEPLRAFDKQGCPILPACFTDEKTAAHQPLS